MKLIITAAKPNSVKPKVIFRGTSGESYTFEVYNRNFIFRKEVSAIYVFARHNKVTNKLKPLYIGETGELSTRILNHEKWPTVIRHGCTHICIHRVTDEKHTRLTIETDLRHRYDPPCNDQNVPASARVLPLQRLGV